ncbi:hypothetical protein ABZ806_20305 [Spirillospora sp. NPDC047418]|jgi:hypothetical protein
MSIEAKVKAANIRKLGGDMEKLADGQLPNAKNILTGISVGFPGFSVIGLPLHFAHERLIKDAADKIDSAKGTMEKFNEALVTTALTWAKADETSSASITY